LDSGRKDKTDSHDARSAAIVALRNRNLRSVVLEDHRQVLRLLARRHHQLTAARTRAICRLHAVLCEMVEGGLSKNLSAKRALSELRKLRPTDAIGLFEPDTLQAFRTDNVTGFLVRNVEEAVHAVTRVHMLEGGLDERLERLPRFGGSGGGPARPPRRDGPVHARGAGEAGRLGLSSGPDPPAFPGKCAVGGRRNAAFPG